jgi:hypothetical protein
MRRANDAAAMAGGMTFHAHPNGMRRRITP